MKAGLFALSTPAKGARYGPPVMMHAKDENNESFLRMEVNRETTATPRTYMSRSRRTGFVYSIKEAFKTVRLLGDRQTIMFCDKITRRHSIPTTTIRPVFFAETIQFVPDGEKNLEILSLLCFIDGCCCLVRPAPQTNRFEYVEHLNDIATDGRESNWRNSLRSI